MKDFSLLEKKLNIYFEDKNLLIQAFTHRSYLNENPKIQWNHNERLEFLGDAVLELSVTDYLYKHFSNPEGELTSWRAALVNATMLAKIAKNLGFDDFLLLSRGEEKDIGKAREYILANTIEAFLGALYLDKGYEIVNQFIIKNIISNLPEIINKRLYKDFKSLFQEESQGRVGITPIYEVIEEWGPDHAKNFKVGVYLNEELVGVGEGSSKQEAQQKAAENALKKKNWGDVQ